MKLEPPHSHHLNAAQGWLGLGNIAEACAELDKLPPKLQSHPEVLEARWQIHAKAEQWEKCVEVANRLVELAPKMTMGWVHRSYALHELKRTREAMEALLPALTMFPNEWLVHYNMACYCCRLGQFEPAMRFLKQALKLDDDKGVKQLALGDPDLKELWKRIEKM